MNMNTSDDNKCVGKKSSKDSGGGKGDEKTNKYQERDFFARFGPQ